MSRKTVGDRLWNENYHVSASGRSKPDSCGGSYQPDVTKEEGLPSLCVKMAYQFSSNARDNDGYTGYEAGVYLYIYFYAGEYEDPYITRYIPFSRDMTNDEQKSLVARTKIHASKDGTVTITPVNEQETVHQLPVPGSERDFQKTISHQMDMGWPVSYGDD